MYSYVPKAGLPESLQKLLVHGPSLEPKLSDSERRVSKTDSSCQTTPEPEDEYPMKMLLNNPSMKAKREQQPYKGNVNFKRVDSGENANWDLSRTFHDSSRNSVLESTNNLSTERSKNNEGIHNNNNKLICIPDFISRESIDLANSCISSLLGACHQKIAVEKIAEFAVQVIEKECHGVFLEILLQQLENLLMINDDRLAICPFTAQVFITHFYLQFKNVKGHEMKLQPHLKLQLLKLLTEFTIIILKNQKDVIEEDVDYLIFVLESVGEDLKNFDEGTFEGIKNYIRFALYRRGGSSKAKKKLLQCLEFMASKWTISSHAKS